MLELSEKNLVDLLSQRKRKEYSIVQLLRYFGTTADKLRELIRKTPALARFVERTENSTSLVMNRHVTKDTEKTVLKLLRSTSSKSYTYFDLSRRLKIRATELKMLLDSLVATGELQKEYKKNGIPCYQVKVSDKPTGTVATPRTFSSKREFQWKLPAYISERLNNRKVYTVPPDVDNDTNLKEIFE